MEWWWMAAANAPFAQILNRTPLYIVRGDQSAYDVKVATEPTSVKACACCSLE